MINEYHPEDMQAEASRRAEICDEIERLERSHKHAESMRREMITRLADVAEARDFWDSEAARILVQLEERKGVCHECHGDGYHVNARDDRLRLDSCDECEGLGTVWPQNLYALNPTACVKCQGHGTLSDDESEATCPCCDGDGSSE